MSSVDNHTMTAKISQELHEVFENHVLNSCVKHDFPSTYFSTGIAEECAEFLDAVNSTKFKQYDGLHFDQNTYNSVISEAGDILWYLYALSLSLPGGKFCIETSSVYEENFIPKPISCFQEERTNYESSCWWCSDTSSSSVT